jgi:hypothetical protein
MSPDPVPNPSINTPKMKKSLIRILSVSVIQWQHRKAEYSNCVERAAASSKPASSQEDEGEDDEETRVTNPRAGPSTRPPQPRKKKQLGFDSRKLDEIPPEYLPSAWLAEYVPKKSPYFPQMGDEVMFYFAF